MQALLFFMGLLFFAGLLGLLYWGYWNARKLDRQIERGDPALLTTSTYKREEVIQAPPGSTIMEGMALGAGSSIGRKVTDMIFSSNSDKQTGQPKPEVVYGSNNYCNILNLQDNLDLLIRYLHS